MNITSHHAEFHLRQLHVELVAPQTEHPPVSPQEQAMIDRRAFLGHQAMARSPEVPRQYEMTIHGVDKLIEDVTPHLSSQYHWLKQVNRQQLASLLNDVIQYRRDYRNEHNKLPLDGRIYRHHRLALEQADEYNSELYDKVVMLEALMDGDILKGSLPPLETYLN